MPIFRSTAKLTFAALLAAVSFSSANALNLGVVVPSSDGVYYASQYPLGNKPSSGTCPPTGYAYSSLGDGGGTFCDSSGTITAVVTGTDSIINSRIITKTCGSADCEIKVEINNDYAGNAASGVAFGAGIRSDTTSAAEVLQCKSLRVGTNAVQCQKRIAGATSSTDCSLSGSASARPVRVAVAWDDSESEAVGLTSVDSGASWQICLRANFSTFSSPYAYLIGGSKSASTSATASFDNLTQGTTITTYTPTGGGGVPTLAPGGIPAQSGISGNAFSLTFSSYFTGATSYSVIGLPGSSGLSETSDGVLSGTIATADVTASPYNLTLRGTNGSGNTDATVAFTFTAPAGGNDIFLIPDVGDTTASTYLCSSASGANGATWSSIRTQGSGTTPGAGDDIVITGGTRGSTTFNNCEGSLISQLTIKNRVTDSVPVKIQVSGTDAFIFGGTSRNIVVDGTGKYVGATSTQNLKTSYGFLLTNTDQTPPVATQPTHYFKAYENACIGTNLDHQTCTFKGIAVDAVDNTGGVGICFSINDHSVLHSGTYPNGDDSIWREGITLTGNLGLFCGAQGEGMYVGPNQSGTLDDVPLRNITATFNWMQDSGRDCYNFKSVYDGANVFTDNVCIRAGQQQANDQNSGINMNSEASWTFARNRVVDADGECFVLNHQEDPIATNNPSTITLENEFYSDCGADGMHFTRNGSANVLTLAIRNVTVVKTVGPGLSCAGNVNADPNDSSSGYIANSILVGIGGAVVSGCDNTNNRTGTTTQSMIDQNFVTFSNDGVYTNDDFHMSATSPACSNANGNVPSTDYDGDSRPLEGASEQGADENTICP